MALTTIPRWTHTHKRARANTAGVVVDALCDAQQACLAGASYTPRSTLALAYANLRYSTRCWDALLVFS